MGSRHRPPSKTGPRTPELVTAPGWMADTTAVSLLLLGSALFLGHRLQGLPWNQFFALGTSVLCIANLVGYVYGISYFTGFAFYTGMAVHTSLSLLMLSVAILFSRPDSGVMALI